MCTLSKTALGMTFAGLMAVSTAPLAQEELEGPGVFSGEKGEFSLRKMFSGKEAPTQDQVQAQAKEQNNNSTVTGADAKPTALGATARKDEFSQFKAYKVAKTNNSPAYQEFLLWLEFQDYKNNKSD